MIDGQMLSVLTAQDLVDVWFYQLRSYVIKNFFFTCEGDSKKPDEFVFKENIF